LDAEEKKQIHPTDQIKMIVGFNCWYPRTW